MSRHNASETETSSSSLTSSGTTSACLVEERSIDLDRDALGLEYREVRGLTETLQNPLTPEDCAIQSMPDVSPTRWHLAHTTWFFETFVLLRDAVGYEPFHPQFGFLFNSYYNALGEQFPRARRGLLSRPTLHEILDYRRHVDKNLLQFLQNASPSTIERVRPVLQIGLHHEQQHQELLLTDIKHVLSCNPLNPVYSRVLSTEESPIAPLRFVPFQEGIRHIGYEGGEFSYDNESPRHRRFLESFELAHRLITNGEYLEFIADGGYERPELWLSEGWHQVQTEGWKAPLYWSPKGENQWEIFTLSGLRGLESDVPVCHVSYFEADAFARWSGARLATEAEWEIASESVMEEGEVPAGNFVEAHRFHPAQPEPSSESSSAPIVQMFGDVWEWTSSPYTGYPGYSPPEGAIGEYNGKFMCNQFVLRGGSCATSKGHIRPTYRNFFPPDARWQFSGIRLAR